MILVLLVVAAISGISTASSITIHFSISLSLSPFLSLSLLSLSPPLFVFSMAQSVETAARQIALAVATDRYRDIIVLVFDYGVIVG